MTGHLTLRKGFTAANMKSWEAEEKHPYLFFLLSYLASSFFFLSFIHFVSHLVRRKDILNAKCQIWSGLLGIFTFTHGLTQRDRKLAIQV